MHISLRDFSTVIESISLLSNGGHGTKMAIVAAGV
jgi:hypothetical protein